MQREVIELNENIDDREVELAVAPEDGVFPEDFYVTTNLKTFVYYEQQWLKVDRAEMDCGIVIEGEKAYCVPMNDIKAGDKVVVGSKGVKEKSIKNKKREEKEFNFMSSEISCENSKAKLIANLAAEMKEIKKAGGEITVVGGPAIIHTGSAKYLSTLIDKGYVNLLLAGNALAVHDIETAIFGTSLDIPLVEERVKEKGHGFHLKAINKVRRAGSIKKAVKKGIIDKGIMYSAVKNEIDYVLAGSIRDDGPLPDVITDTVKAQEMMREKLHDTDLVLMLATMLHSIATGNLLAADIKSVCVDINSDTVTKLADRGTAQAQGIVTDVELFLSSLVNQL